MRNNKILIICAHPDDDILGCGGIISKYLKLGISIRIIFIAEGSSCRYPIDQIDAPKVLKVINERNSYGISALKKLGIVDFKFYNMPCGRLDSIPILEINKIIENEIREFSPETIYTHSEFDTNNDHRIIFNSTLMATRPTSNCTVKNLFTYEILSSSEWRYTKSFEPNYFEELSEDEVQKKWEALAEYETEIKDFPFPRSKDGIITLAKFRGMQSGYKFAEAFKIIRIFK
jgi:LmbE family N-acetylglucosaminyl deacetylase